MAKKTTGEKNPHDKHRMRVRKRFREEGLASFEDHEALELLLFYCIPRQDTNEMAHKFLEKYSSLSNLFEASCDDLMHTLKITENTAVLLSLIPHLCSKYMMGRWSSRPQLSNLDEAGEYCVSILSSKQFETFFLLCLDSGKKLISTNVISEGSVDEVHVYPRKVIEAAVRFKAHNVILTHNHPGGSLLPSFSDIETTMRIVEALNLIGIAVFDHIIVCGTSYYSFKKENLLKKND